jgi:hypothetical protein
VEFSFNFAIVDENSPQPTVNTAMKEVFKIFIRNPAQFKRELEMKKILLLTLAVLLLLMPSAASAAHPPVGPEVTIASGVTIAGDGLSFTITFIPVASYTVTFCDGTQVDGNHFDAPPDPWETYAYNKPIAQVEVYPFLPPTINGGTTTVLGLINGYTIVASRNCEPADPLFMMWLLTRGDQGCILLSETHPSVERQKALCFPATDPDWVADNAPCADYVYDNDTWSCDAFGFPRLPLYDETGPDLMQVWQRHAARQQE